MRRVLPGPAIWAVALLGGAVSYADEPKPAAAFFVAPDGNDGWSGKLAKPNADKTDGPFATPARARDAVRELRRGRKPAGPVVVTFAAGRYELREPLTITPDDSGTAESPTVFRAAPGERVVLSGGRRVSGWKAGADGMWSAPWRETAGFRFVSVNGVMRGRPRLPAEDFHDIAGLAGADPKGKYDTPANKFEFADHDIRGDWRNLRDVEVVVLHFWVDTHFKVKSVNESTRVVTFDRSSRRKLTTDHGPKPARYYILNVFEGLKEPGHFYHDRSAGVLYYLPARGEDGATAEVIVPALPQVVRFAGEPQKGRFVEHVHLRGITLSDTHWEPAPNDAVDGQAASNVPGAVQLRGARNCAVEGCTVTNVTGYGIELLDGSRGNRIVRNELTRVGAGGIKLTGGASGSPENLRTGANVITDNHLHHLGELFHSGVGILSMHADDNTIAHNHIHDLYYTGISVGWVWGYAPSVSRGNRIEHNLIHDVGKKLLSDMGGIYTLGVSPGTVVRGNVIHDVDAYTYGGWGVYTDEGSTGILIENNLVYRTKTGGFHQHYGKENVVRNNVFALAREDQIERSRAEPHVSFAFERNIVYYTTGTLLGKNWKDDKFVMDHNVYWNAAGRPVTFPGGLTFEQWQARGFDRHSLVADPLFVDPEKGDFRLREGSPAPKVGFVPFDYTKAGVRKE